MAARREERRMKAVVAVCCLGGKERENEKVSRFASLLRKHTPRSLLWLGTDSLRPGDCESTSDANENSAER